MTRIAQKWQKLKQEGRNAFIPYITAGDPDLATTEALLLALAAAGADIIELGAPFSDPVADGTVIQRASERALKKGVTLSDALRCVSKAKQHVDIPIVLFSYLNPLLKFGQHRLAKEARRSGIDSVLITDLIPEEAGAWIEALHDHEIDLIFLVAPTTSDERLTRIAQQAMRARQPPLEHEFGERDAVGLEQALHVAHSQSVALRNRRDRQIFGEMAVHVGLDLTQPHGARAVERRLRRVASRTERESREDRADRNDSHS